MIDIESPPMGPIFIVGNSRSGTTMLGSILDNHDKIHTFDELHFFEQQVDVYTVHKKLSWPRKRLIFLLERLLTTARNELFNKVTPGQYREDAERIVTISDGDDPVSIYKTFLYYETKKYGKLVPCEQTPRYVFFIDEILKEFPNAYVINMVRDPRDVLLSQKNKWRRHFLSGKRIPIRESFRSWVNYHPYTIARLWVSAVRTANRFEKHPRVVSIRYEDILQYPETTVRTLCEFTGLLFHPAMLNVPQVGSSLNQDHPERKGIDGNRTGNWRRGGLSTLELSICQRIAVKEMNLLGYTLEPVQVPAWHRVVSMVVCGIKLTMALFLNLGRTKNLRNTIQRRLFVGALTKNENSVGKQLPL